MPRYRYVIKSGFLVVHFCLFSLFLKWNKIDPVKELWESLIRSGLCFERKEIAIIQVCQTTHAYWIIRDELSCEMLAWLPRNFKAGTHEGACSRSTLLQHAPGAKLPGLHQRFLAKKICCATKLLLISNWFDMREQAPGANLLHEFVSGVSSLVCVVNSLSHVLSCSSLIVSLVCTGWGTYPGACFGSVFQEQAPSCAPAFINLWFWNITLQSGSKK